MVKKEREREREKERERKMDGGRKIELQAGETGVRTEMSDESEAFWEDAPV